MHGTLWTYVSDWGQCNHYIQLLLCGVLNLLIMSEKINVIQVLFGMLLYNSVNMWSTQSWIVLYDWWIGKDFKAIVRKD